MSEDDGIEYEPVGVEKVPGEMKDIAVLLVDRSYSSIRFKNAAPAEEVLALEDEVDLLQLQARLRLVMAGRRPAEAGVIVPIDGIVAVAENVSDAALETADGVRRGAGSRPFLEAAVQYSDEITDRPTVLSGSRPDGTAISDDDLKTRTGMHIVTIRRESPENTGRKKNAISPRPDTTLRAGDVLVPNGTRAGADSLSDRAT
ncbi:MAG: potassium channel family protein [Halanaeroarchaeum sp.]